MQSDVLIIGGGISGLTAAVLLGDHGLRVTVIEREAIAGGRARSWTDPTTQTPVDLGPHILTSLYPNLLAWLRRLGTLEQIVWSPDRAITLVQHGRAVRMRMHPLPAPLPFLPSLLAAAVSPGTGIALHDLLSNASASWQAMILDERRVRELDSQNARDYLHARGVSARFIEWFWASLAMTILNAPLECCSAGAVMRFYQQMIGHGDYQVGFPSAGLSDLFVAQATSAIRASGGSLLLRSTATGLFVDNGRVRGVELADGRRLESDHCIAALAPDALHTLIPRGWNRRPFSDLGRFEASPYISTYLWFAEKLNQERFWTRVWSPSTLNYDFYDLSNIRPALACGPSVIASNIIYSHRAANLSDADVIQATREELAEFVPAARRVPLVHARVHRVPMSIPCPQPGTECCRPSTISPVPGLLLAGDWTDTALPASMESAARSGALAAECVLAGVGRPTALALPPPAIRGLTGGLQRLARRVRR